MNTNKKICISVAEDRCFFHVFGDKHKYFDLYSLQVAHPELNDYCKEKGLELERDLLRKNELIGKV